MDETGVVDALMVEVAQRHAVGEVGAPELAPRSAVMELGLPLVSRTPSQWSEDHGEVSR
jgi:hypothetical protein